MEAWIPQNSGFFRKKMILNYISGNFPTKLPKTPKFLWFFFVKINIFVKLCKQTYSFSGLQTVNFARANPTIVAGNSPDEASLVLLALAQVQETRARLYNVFSAINSVKKSKLTEISGRSRRDSTSSPTMDLLLKSSENWKIYLKNWEKVEESYKKPEKNLFLRTKTPNFCELIRLHWMIRQISNFKFPIFIFLPLAARCVFPSFLQGRFSKKRDCFSKSLNPCA